MSKVKSKTKLLKNKNLSDEDKLNKPNTTSESAEAVLGKVLDEIRPALMRDGGNLELVKYDKKKGIVEIVLQGACAHCPLADVTLKQIIEAEIKSHLPEIKEVRAV